MKKYIKHKTLTILRAKVEHLTSQTWIVDSGCEGEERIEAKRELKITALEILEAIKSL